MRRLNGSLHSTHPLAVVVLAISALLFLSASTAGAQVRGNPQAGSVSIVQRILELGTTASALVIGAHPDDEDSLFMAEAVRGEHARVGYLTLTRGEGGQNAIGADLFDILGVIRTEELLQARTLDGGSQFFGRELDFGFSKTDAEASRMWGDREVLGDMVRVIRMFRPLVVYSVWSGVPADGHGHHQLSGRLAKVAFRAAGDPTQYPEQVAEGLRPWQAKKFYQFRGYGPSAGPGTTTTIQGGSVDPLLGLTYAQVAAQGRTQHKTQAMGTPEIRGPVVANLSLVDSTIRAASGETSVFDGIDTSITGIPALAGLPEGALHSELEDLNRTLAAAIDSFSLIAPEKSVPALAAALRSIRDAREAVRKLQAPAETRAEADFLLGSKEEGATLALQGASGVVVDPVSEVETASASESFVAVVRVFFSRPDSMQIDDVSLTVPPGWSVSSAPVPPPGPGSIPEFANRTAAFRVTVADDALPTQPYWLRQPKQGNEFVWPQGSPKAQPFDAPQVMAVVKGRIAGLPVTLRQPLQYRAVDPVRGELRRNVEIVPAVTLSFDSQLELVSLDTRRRAREVVVSLQNNSRGPLSGILRLEVPEGWISSPAESPFSVKEGEKSSITLSVTPASALVPGNYSLHAVATVGARRFDQSMQTLAYEHIQTHRVYSPAAMTLSVLDLKVAPVRVGYIMGSGDHVPEAIRRMGLEVRLLDERALSSGNLADFDTIVVGVNASSVRPDFVASLPRLYSWVKDGGALIVQYQHPDFVQRNLPPFPAKMASRVTDETAEVRILVPDHPAFTKPNRITNQDFAGWVQERNLFAFTTFDQGYVPLLESHDPGEPPQTGGEVDAPLGTGHFVYTAYDWFRELPAGVPGAYRLFANLISLGVRSK
jgi:LmbE family N-acetylglucosaminyl deacetylase